MSNQPTSRTSKNWQGIFEEVPELDLELKEIRGKIPTELVGTLYKNGPGSRRFSRSFFDGDGMIRALSIDEKGKVSFKSRFVHTPKYLKEKNSTKAKVRTAGTNLPGGIFKNAFRIPADEANTHVFHHQNKLWACEEGGHPWVLDEKSLNTEKEFHFNGALPRQVAFSAHPHYDKRTQEIYNFGMKPGKTMGFKCYKFDKNLKLTMLAGFPANKGTFAHDYALSGKWMAFILPPLAGNLKKFLFGLQSFFDTMQWHEDWGTQIVLVPRDGGKALIFETESFSVGHVLSAWDEGDDLVIDLGTVGDFSVMNSVANYRQSDWKEFGDGEVSRLRINTKALTVEKTTLTTIPAEFPRIHPDLECQKAKWAYLASNTTVGEGGLFRATMKLNRENGDTEIFDFGEHATALEPVFIPKHYAKSEDDGWLMTYVFHSDTQTSSLEIINALALRDGPVASIHLPFNIGTTFHGTWVKKQ